jgi:hypothetical protein
MFNDIHIAKYGNSGNVVKYVKVPIKLAGKDKVWYWLKDLKQDKYTPVISAQMTAITHAPDRIAGIHEYISSASDLFNRCLMPVPYDLDFSLSIFGQYMVELDQILEQIMVFFNPEAFIRINIPELNLNYEIKVVISTANLDYPVTMQEEEYRLMTWTIPFIVQTYLFKPKVEVGVIEKIFTNFYKDKTKFEKYVGTETEYTSGGPGNYYDESIFIGGTGIDNDGNILYNYEIFGENT